MIRKYHNHKPQTNPWHREEEQNIHHDTQGRQTKDKSKEHFIAIFLTKAIIITLVCNLYGNTSYVA